MYLSESQTFIIILSVALGTMITRFTPFLLFPDNKKQPKIIIYLGHMLPCAMMGLLVIYCLKDVTFTQGSHGIPEIISILAVVIIHKLKNNVFLSIGAGTAIYMFLVQRIFI